MGEASGTLVRLHDFRRTADTAAPRVFFDRKELSQLLNVYSRRVMSGEWRDYAIDHDGDRATFSIYRHAAEVPAFAITKLSRSQAKGKGRFTLTAGPRRLKQAQTLDEVIAALEKTLRVVWTNR